MRRPRVLLTAFEPFGGELVNPAERVASVLARREHLDVALRVAVLPVDRTVYAAALAHALDAAPCDLAVGLGQAAGRRNVDVESTAWNRLDFGGERDNGGHDARGEELRPGGPPALRSSLPLERVTARLQAAGHPVRHSVDAGRHLCNAWLWTMLDRAPGTPAAFVHVPLLPEQAARRARGEPSLPLDVMAATCTALLTRLAAAAHTARAARVRSATLTR